jgi:hypothetical protein
LHHEVPELGFKVTVTIPETVDPLLGDAMMTPAAKTCVSSINPMRPAIMRAVFSFFP